MRGAAGADFEYILELRIEKIVDYDVKYTLQYRSINQMYSIR